MNIDIPGGKSKIRCNQIMQTVGIIRANCYHISRKKVFQFFDGEFYGSLPKLSI